MLLPAHHCKGALDGSRKILRPLNPFAVAAGRTAHVFEGRIAVEGGTNEARRARVAIKRMPSQGIRTLSSTMSVATSSKRIDTLASG